VLDTPGERLAKLLSSVPVLPPNRWLYCVSDIACLPSVARIIRRATVPSSALVVVARFIGLLVLDTVPSLA